MLSLKNARIGAGFTQGHLAKALGKPQSYVAKIEVGERRIDVVEFVSWMKVTGKLESASNTLIELAEIVSSVEDGYQDQHPQTFQHLEKSTK